MYASLMVNLGLGHPNQAVLQVAGDLAARFDARVIGIAVCQPTQVGYPDGNISGELFAQDRAELDHEIGKAESEFRAALAPRVSRLEWRSAISFASLSECLCCESRAADLLITGGPAADASDGSRNVDLGDLVMQVGRPILVVPARPVRHAFDRIVIGWKDTRATRRAVADALPLLAKASHVTVVEVVAEDNLHASAGRLKDVVGWLACHGVTAEAVSWPSDGDDHGQLHAIAREHQADVIVAGAYGHSRLREWVLGGVTRSLLLHAESCVVLAH